MPPSLHEQLMTSGSQYNERFGHPVPQSALRELEPRDLLSQLNAALASGKPIEGWSEKYPTDVLPREKKPS